MKTRMRMRIMWRVWRVVMRRVQGVQPVAREGSRGVMQADRAQQAMMVVAAVVVVMRRATGMMEMRM
jgi:hypothetical protein